MGTLRVTRTSGAPSTQFDMEADWASQSQKDNYSTCYFWLRATNRGGSGSYDNNQGAQLWQMDGQNYNGHYDSLPPGYGTGQLRWYDGPWQIQVKHDANGNLGAQTIRQIIQGWFAFNDAVTLPAPPRIPKPPTAPGRPSASEITPTSMRLTWAKSADAKGSAIDFYLLRRWANAEGTGAYVDSKANNLTRVVTGLEPGKTYSFRVYAHNGSYGGYSVASGLWVAKTVAASRVRVAGIWEYAIAYVKKDNKWYEAQPMVRSNGDWKNTG